MALKANEKSSQALKLTFFSALFVASLLTPILDRFWNVVAPLWRILGHSWCPELFFDVTIPKSGPKRFKSEPKKLQNEPKRPQSKPKRFSNEATKSGLADCAKRSIAVF